MDSDNNNENECPSCPPSFLLLAVLNEEETRTTLSATATHPLSTSQLSVISAPSNEEAAKEPTPFSNLRIDDKFWLDQMQDLGCTKDDLPKTSYKANKIPPFGPDDNIFYYFELSSIAIDYMHYFKTMKNDGRGWYKIPKNLTDVKMKITGLLLSMKKNVNISKYILD